MNNQIPPRSSNASLETKIPPRITSTEENIEIPSAGLGYDDDDFIPSAGVEHTGTDDDIAETTTHPVTVTATTSAVPSSPVLLPTVYSPTGKPDFICPFCMDDIYSGDIRYYCNHHRELDEKKQVRKVLRKVFKPEEITSGMRRAKNQIYCCTDYITANRLCPNCVEIAPHTRPPRAVDAIRVLPHEIYTSGRNEFRLCLTGFSRSGKTEYITQLLQYLSTRETPGVDATFFMGEQTKAIKDSIREKSFKDGRMPNTPAGYLDPLLYDIRRDKNSYKSVFYDISGEDFGGLNSSVATRCITSSPNIILMIDPTVLPEVQDHPKVKEMIALGNQTSSGDINDSLSMYLTFMRDKYQSECDRHLRKNVYVAVVITKMDLFYDDDDLPAILKPAAENEYDDNQKKKAKKYDYHDADAVGDAMKTWLRKKGGGALVGSLTSIPNVRLFGLSSRKGSIDDANARRNTNRLLDPYLWLLYQNRIIK